MRAPTTTLILLALALPLGCTEYDIYREPEKEDDPVVDSEPPEEEPVLEADIEVRPKALTFGSLPKDCPSEAQEVVIQNVGDATLNVSELAFDGSGTSNFALDGTVTALEPGESATVLVTFTPLAAKTFSVKLVATSDDPDEPTSSVKAEGTGAEDSTYEEAFEQSAFESVDVLWIVDNSGSMSAAVGQVKSNFQSFMSEFSKLNLDYQLGVVTTDMMNPAESGCLQGPEGVTYVTPSTPDAENVFAEMIDQGIMGSGDEKGLSAARAALTDPLLTGYNAGFLRDDAALAVIVVTDEDDSSPFSPTDFATWLLGLKADPSRVSFSGITGPDPLGCSEWVGVDFITAVAGTKYNQAVTLTGGIQQAICSSTFDDALQYLSLTAVGMEYRFPLTQVPSNIGAMFVSVDGVEVDYYDGSNGWTYDPSDNHLVFHGETIPPPESDISVSYPVASECPS